MPEPTPISFADAAEAAFGADPTPGPTSTPESTPTPTPTPTPEPIPEPDPEIDPLVSSITESLLGPDPEADSKPTPEPTPNSEDKLPADGPQTKSAQQKWAEMRLAAKWKKENEPELARLKAEVDDLKKKTSGGDDPEKRQLRAQSEAAIAALRIRDVQSTPEYVENISKPMEQIVEAAQGMAKDNELSESRVILAIKETDPKRQNELLTELAEGLNDRDKNRLFSMADKYGEFKTKGKYLEDNAKIALDTLIKSKEAKQSERVIAMKKMRSDALTAVGTEFKKTLFLLKPIEGQDAWNAGIEQLDQLATKVEPESMHPISRAKLIYQGLLLPRAMEFTQRIVTENQSLRRALKKNRQALPSGGAPTPTGPAPSGLEGLSFLEAMEKK